MTYRVSNNSGEDLLFAPAFELSSGPGVVLRSGRDVPLEVTRELMKQTQNEFIEDQISIIGQLLQGKENAKDGIVIWPLPAFSEDTVTLYAAGFSGETATVQLPDSPDSKVVLRKTMMMRFRVPGTLEHQQSRPLELLEKRWIMR
jgi:hypothetical protein